MIAGGLEKSAPRAPTVIYVAVFIVGSPSLQGPDVRESPSQHRRAQAGRLSFGQTYCEAGSVERSPCVSAATVYLKDLNDPFCCGLKPSDTPPALLRALETGMVAI